MVTFTQHDLQFILAGIEVSATHADATNTVAGDIWLQSDIETQRQILRGLLPNSLEPIGMRTIDGELNNLELGNDQFGATGNEFPRLTGATYLDDGLTGNPADGSLFGPGTNTDYAQSGDGSIVVDSDPRIISNLLVDISVRNPAAIARAGLDPNDFTVSSVLAAGYDPGADGIIGTADDIGTQNGSIIIDPDVLAAPGDPLELSGNEQFFIPNVAPDVGLSAPFNGWMTFFGQFFDHGLDLVQKGGSGIVFIPLQADDPLVTHGPNGILGDGDEVDPNLAFIPLTRATVDPGPDGVLGTADDVRGPENFTSPFVDQNQTYTSHPSHQLFLREYTVNNASGLFDSHGDEIPTGAPVATGRLVEHRDLVDDLGNPIPWVDADVLGGMATWGDVKVQAAQLLGIELTDAEVTNIPLFAVDQYGEFIRGASGLPQFVMSDGSLFEGNLLDPVSVADAEAATGKTVQFTNFAFLLDIAHNAAPTFDLAGDLNPDANTTIDSIFDLHAPGAPYDDELLDAHYIAGDGRSNENIALTTVHTVFHQEHNRLADQIKDVLLASATNPDLATVGDPLGAHAALDLLNGYLAVPVGSFPTTQVEIDNLVWNGDRLFQAAKFGTEMQYQHLVFEEFARKVQPLVDVFASFEPGIDPSITMEFSQAVYRFGHSMLTENIDVLDADGNLTEVGLIQAFLNPEGFNHTINADGTVGDIGAQDSHLIAGAIVRGMVRERGSEIDEFVTDALRNNLLGLPLDLAAINIARGRDVGLPTLNEVRATFYEGTGDVRLKPYDSWMDFAAHLKNELSIVNFIAAYGQHESITGATTLVEKRDAAFNLVFATPESPDDRIEFLTSSNQDGVGTDWSTAETGLNLVDLWIGGLAEAIEPFGGFLGSTFNFVFEEQLESLQDGDRFYYLFRTAGLNLIDQLEQNSFAKMVIQNTSIGDTPGDHVPGDIFAKMDFILEVDQTKQFNEGLGDFVVTEPTVIGESGTVDVAASAGPDGTFSVAFTDPIPNAVIVLTINTNNDSDSAVTRIVTSDANGFTARIDEFDAMATTGTGPETISWIAITEGEHVLPDGTVIKAGFTTADTTIGGAGSTVTFGTAFAADPIVLTTVTGANAGDPSEPALSTQLRSDVDTGVGARNQQNPTPTGFQVRVFEQEINAQDSVAQVGWIAISQGTGTDLVAGVQNGVTDAIVADNISFGTTITDPVFLAHAQNATQSGNTFTVRGDGFDEDSATVFISEETSLDTETIHAATSVGFLAIGAGLIISDPGITVAHAADPEGGTELFPLVIRDDPSTIAVETNYLKFTGGEKVVLGGTDEADTIIGGRDDDTIWGDGGNDRLEGGDGNDLLFGGDGDDIITDTGGVDNIQGEGGNDAIFSGEGIDLILAGDGKDFVLGGPDFAETFGGAGDDFIHSGTESNTSFGNEGNDWIEGGGGNNLLVGDNGSRFLNSTVGGHDVFIPGTGDDDFDAEGGDDIMLGGDGIQRFAGMNGFDWATYARVTEGINADMLLRAFDVTPVAPGASTILDRFASVQGLSGGDFTDILRGDNANRLLIATLDNGNDSVLRDDGTPTNRFAMIDGLREGDHGFVDADAARYNPIFADGTLEWGEGDIILGGAGSDLIEGRGGNDIIDGDLKLDVRLLVTDGAGNPLATAYEMYGELLAVDANGVPTGAPAPIGGFATLQEAVFGGVVNPGNIEIVREIIDMSGVDDFNVAQFSDVITRYTFDANLLDAQGFFTVSHNDPVLGAGRGIDGVDMLRNIDRLVFQNQSINLNNGDASNSLATGRPLILDEATGEPWGNGAPEVGQQLRATPNDIADADGFDADGIPPDTDISYIWQVERNAGTNIFTDLLVVGVAGLPVALQGEVITVPIEANGLAMRVRALFLDGVGVPEQVFSAPTGAVGAPGVTIIGTSGPDIIIPQQTTVGPDIIDGRRGNDIIDGGAGNDTISGGPGNDDLRGSAGNDLIGGGAGADDITGGLGDDDLRGNGGNDTIEGGAGNDRINGGAGANDTAVFNGNSTDFSFVFSNGGTVLTSTDNNVGDGLDEGTDTISNTEVLNFNGDGVTVNVADLLAAAGGADGVPVTVAAIAAGIVHIEEATADGIINVGEELTANVTFDTSEYGIELQWEASTNGVDGWQPIAGATAETYTPTDSDIGSLLRVAVDYTSATGDGNFTPPPTAYSDPTPAAVVASEVPGGDTGTGTTDTTDTGGTGTGTQTPPLGLTIEVGYGATDKADMIAGSDGYDEISAGGGADIIDAGDGNDVVYGGSGADYILGGLGNDVLFGGTGNDTLTGGADDDTFVFESGFGTDEITDFTDGEDIIDLIDFHMAFEDLTITQRCDDTIIRSDADGFGKIILEHFDADKLTADDFFFS